MKILFLMNHIIMGGLEKVLLQYLDSMSKRGIKVTVISPSAPVKFLCSSAVPRRN